MLKITGRVAVALVFAVGAVLWSDVASYAAGFSMVIGPANSADESWWGPGAYVECSGTVVAPATGAILLHQPTVEDGTGSAYDMSGNNNVDVELWQESRFSPPDQPTNDSADAIANAANGDPTPASIVEGRTYRICLNSYDQTALAGFTVTAGDVLGDIAALAGGGTTSVTFPDSMETTFSAGNEALIMAGFGLLILLAGAQLVSLWGSDG